MGNNCSVFLRRCPCFGKGNDEESEPLLTSEAPPPRKIQTISARSVLGRLNSSRYSSCENISSPIINQSPTSSLSRYPSGANSIGAHNSASPINSLTRPGPITHSSSLAKSNSSSRSPLYQRLSNEPEHNINQNTFSSISAKLSDSSITKNENSSTLKRENHPEYIPAEDVSDPSFSFPAKWKDADTLSLLSSTSDVDVPTKRHRTAMELLQTETTYLRNLNTIIKVYQEPLQKAADEGHPLLAPEDIRNAFGGIGDIAKLHAHIHHDLSEIIDDWEEDCCIAHIFTKYREQLLKVYPPFVNYFDMGKEALLKQEKANPALREFFQACFHEPQSLKQPLDALLIRPVQRLPSISLIINDLHKRTPDGLRDKTELEEAKTVLKQVLSHINEDKRKTEGKMKIFDIVYEVDGCPVEVVSSNRLFISRVDVSTLNDGLYRSGERLALYLLTDVLEVAKWRNRSHGKSAPLLKHIQLLPLNNIISIWDVQDGEECKNIFAVKYKSIGNSIIDTNGQEEKLSVLQLFDDRAFKSKWVNALAKQTAEVNGGKPESFVQQMEPSELASHVKKSSKLFKKLRGKTKAE